MVPRVKISQILEGYSEGSARTSRNEGRSGDGGGLFGRKKSEASLFGATPLRTLNKNPSLSHLSQTGMSQLGTID